MKTILAQKAGFCFGVKRALDLAMKTARETNNSIYTLGPLIHNPQVVEDLSKKGIKVVQDISDIPDGVIIVRSHGVGPEIFEKAREMGLHIIDATCPFVKKAQELAKELNDQGYQVVVVGDKEHPEVTGIIGWTGHRGMVVETPEQAENLQPMQKIGIISQTTQPEENFNRIVATLEQKSVDIQTYNTICHATRDRQEAAVQLAKKVDVMLVIGGKNSANTLKLARLCTETGTPTHHIETAAEINEDWLDGKDIIGITAGASTPDWIIEEVNRYMEDITNQENEKRLLEEALVLKQLHQGDVVKGIVVQVGDDEVLVDVGGKSEGVVPLRECSCCDLRSPRDIFQIGDEIEVAVISVKDDEGKILLSKRKADAEKAWDVLKQAMEEKTVVEGIVTEVVKGGILVDIGVQGFMPASLVERGYVAELGKFVGEKLSAMVLEVNRESRKVILSRKAILEEEYRSKKTALWTELEEGQVRKGVVRRLTNFGAFVDLGGTDGLLHISEMAWYRVGHPSEILKENDEIEVFVLSVDKSTEKISLSLKKILPSPWHAIEEKYAVGSVVTGKVIRIAPFGAFVELEPGVDGLIHISQFSDKRINTPTDVVKVGDEVTAKITEIDLEKHKIGLSVRQLKKDQEITEGAIELEKVQQQQQEVAAQTIGEALGDKIIQELAKVSEQKALVEVSEQKALTEVSAQRALTEVSEKKELAEISAPKDPVVNESEE